MKTLKSAPVMWCLLGCFIGLVALLMLEVDAAWLQTTGKVLAVLAVSALIMSTAELLRLALQTDRSGGGGS